MSVPMLHPEELLDRERNGSLSADERARLDAHSAECAACRLERSARADFDAELDAADEDDALLGRAIDGAMAQTPVRARPRPLGHRIGLLAAAAMLVAISAVAAWSRYGKRVEAPPPPVMPAAEAPAVELPRPKARAAADDQLPVSPLPEPEPSSSVKAPEKAPTAAELFASATRARHDKNDAEAIRLYRELERRYPTSREASASRVVLGQLLLDQKDPNQALDEFNGYLKGGAKGAVTEEAVVGRARALQKLGRTSEERAAWQELLAKFPSSVHADEARARLGATKE